MKTRCISLMVAMNLVIGCGWSRSSDLPEFPLSQIMVIGERDEPEYSFHSMGGIAVDRRGTLYVTDAGDSRIRVYARSGRFVRDIGRSGHGPGEFLGIGRTGLIGGTLYVIDRAADRVTYFDTAGHLLGTARATRGNHGQGSVVLFPHMLLGGGREISSVLHPGSDPQAGRNLLLLTQRGEVLDTLLNVEVTVSLHFRVGRANIFAKNVFAPPILFPVSPSGEYVAAIRMHPDGTLKPGEIEVRLYRPGGEAIWTSVFADVPVTYDSRKADSLVTELLQPLRERGLPLTQREYKAAARQPRYEWPAQRAAVGDDGRVFIELSAGGNRARWLIINHRGKALGTFTLPPSSGVPIVRGDTIIASYPDALGVPRVAEWRIGRPD